MEKPFWYDVFTSSVLSQIFKKDIVFRTIGNCFENSYTLVYQKQFYAQRYAALIQKSFYSTVLIHEKNKS